MNDDLALLREELRRSLRNPHPLSARMGEEGITEWSARLAAETVAGLVDMQVGRAIRWVPGEGWREEPGS